MSNERPPVFKNCVIVVPCFVITGLIVGGGGEREKTNRTQRITRSNTLKISDLLQAKFFLIFLPNQFLSSNCSDPKSTYLKTERAARYYILFKPKMSTTT